MAWTRIVEQRPKAETVIVSLTILIFAKKTIPQIELISAA